MQIINYLQGQVFEQVLLKYMKLLIKDMHMNYFHIKFEISQLFKLLYI